MAMLRAFEIAGLAVACAQVGDGGQGFGVLGSEHPAIQKTVAHQKNKKAKKARRSS